MGLFDYIKKKEPKQGNTGRLVYADMLNGTIPIFSSFGQDIYASDVVRQAVMCIVSEVKKVDPQHVIMRKSDTEPVHDAIQSVLENPNPLMTSVDLIEKTIWLLYKHANAWVIPVWDGDTLKELYPVEPEHTTFLKDNRGKIFVKFSFVNKYKCVIPYDDVIHMRLEFSMDEFMGGNKAGKPDHSALMKTLELNNTLLEGVGKALKSSFAINGVIKYKTMMDGGKTDKALEELTRAIKSNESGFLPLDISGEFVPFKREIKVVDSETLKFIDTKILRHFGVPLPILTGDYSTEQYDAFFQKTLEPLIKSMSQAYTKCLFSKRETFGHGHKIMFYAKALRFLNTDQKLEFVRMLGDSGALMENEKRTLFGLPPLKELVGVRKQSLNYVDVNIANKYQLSGAPASTNGEGGEDVKQGEAAPAVVEEVLENE